MVSDAHERRLAETAAELTPLAGSEVLGVPCDVTVEADVQRLYATVLTEHGRSTWPCTTPVWAATGPWST